MRKKVLILGHNAATQFIDIYNQYTRLFDKNQYEVTVAYLTGAAQEAVRTRTLAEQVLFLNIPKKCVRMLKIGAINTLLALTREKNFDIVICHRYKPTYIMMMVNLFHRIPALIFVMHELNTMSAVARRLVIAALFRKNMLFAGVSNAVRDDMRRRLWFIPASSVVTLYNMIDVELTEPQFYSRQSARSALQLSEQDFIFGNVARLVPNKDQNSLIQAFSLIKPYCPHAKLVLIGSGPLESTLKAQVRACGLEQDIIFTGYLAEGFRYMKAFDCFVLSSVQEAFGRVLLEAMVAKRPVIASGVHGIPEVVGEVGILVKPRNVKDLSSAMQHVYKLTEREREQMGEKGYQRAINQFSIPCFQQIFWQLPLIKSLKE